MQWDIKPGDSWKTSPPIKEGDGAGLVIAGPGAVAPDWVRCPVDIPSCDVTAGTKLYIDRPFVSPHGDLPCPVCQDQGPKRGLAFKDVSVVILECSGCKQFLWLERESEGAAQDD
jgi:hypothetical protein